MKKDNDFIYQGREPIEEKSNFKQFFCLHPESEGQPRMKHYAYPDIEYVQCEKCGFWHYEKSRTKGGALRLLKEMVKW